MCILSGERLSAVYLRVYTGLTLASCRKVQNWYRQASRAVALRAAVMISTTARMMEHICRQRGRESWN